VGKDEIYVGKGGIFPQNGLNWYKSGVKWAFVVVFCFFFIKFELTNCKSV
jgi:hypothetical protein